jgi:hypothetical protein
MGEHAVYISLYQSTVCDGVIPEAKTQTGLLGFHFAEYEVV